jgi:GAF domain-containing protein
VFTDKEAPEIDSAQYESGSGPCIQAFRTGSMYRVDDTEDESRWPEFVAAAREHGVRSTLSLPLSSEEQPIGALNLYSSKVAAFDDSEQMAMVFVAHAASVLGNAAAYWEGRTLSEQLQSALMSRPVIEQAKGILMREHGCDADQAFTMLSRISQHSNRKLRDVASDVVGEAVTGQRPHLGGETDSSPPPS